jgi:hypothetical protein
MDRARHFGLGLDKFPVGISQDRGQKPLIEIMYNKEFAGITKYMG